MQERDSCSLCPYDDARTWSGRLYEHVIDCQGKAPKRGHRVGLLVAGIPSMSNGILLIDDVS